MASGDITNEYDQRKAGLNRSAPTCGLTVEIVVADGTSDKTVELDEVDHPCMNCTLTDLYLEAPAIVTASKLIKLELLNTRDNIIYSTGDLDATNADDHEVHTLRGLRGKTAFKITCDANVIGAKTFMVTFEGAG